MEFSSLGDAVDSVVVKGSNVVEGASTVRNGVSKLEFQSITTNEASYFHSAGSRL
jgi:hypothetical protein